MQYVIKERKGAAVLTGEYGSGKTLLSRVLMEELLDEKYKVALIFNPNLPNLQMLKEIIYQLCGEYPTTQDKALLIHKLDEILYGNYNLNKKTVILVDEAQAIDDDQSFDELRLLLNFQLNDTFLLTIILLGQPELKERINNLPQFRQRLSVRYHLKALDANETYEYVKYRLKIAGAQEEIFEEPAFNEIYRFSGGIPRKINNICDLSLLVASGENLAKINKNTITEVAEDLEETPIEIKDL